MLNKNNMQTNRISVQILFVSEIKTKDALLMTMLNGWKYKINCKAFKSWIK